MKFVPVIMLMFWGHFCLKNNLVNYKPIYLLMILCTRCYSERALPNVEKIKITIVHK